MSIRRINRSRAILMLCDIQEKFLPHTYCWEPTKQSIILSLKIANIFKLPVIATQHNPKAFGKLIPQLSSLLPVNSHLSQKIHFSMIDHTVQSTLSKYPERDQIILVGMETHACILQTHLDLRQLKYEVFLPLDAITSIRSSDRTYAIQRLLSEGGVISSVESLAFELLGNYKDEHFKEIAKVLKESGPRNKIISHL